MKKFWKLLLFALAFRVVFAFVVWHPDLWSNADWGIRFWQYGPAKFFAPESNVWNYTWPNQPPGTIYLYAGIRKLYEFLFSIVWFINVKIPAFPSGIVSFFEDNLYSALLQLPSILADFGIAYLIFKIVQSTKYKVHSNWAAAIWLLNPAVWYNSSVWGQTDSYINFFILLSFYLLYKHKSFWSIFAFAFSIYTKISLAIFLPIYVIVLFKKTETKKILFGILGTLAIIGLATLPFSSGKEPFSWLAWLYQKKVLTQQLQVITANAFNFWAMVAGIHERPQSLPFFGLTYQYWGYILFGCFFFPLLWKVRKRQNKETLFWALSLTALGAFVFLTNMHERYLYPLFPYLTLLAARNRKVRPLYWTVSAINLLNLYNFWWVPRIGILVSFLSFGDRLTPRVFGLIMTGIFIYLWILFTTRKENSRE